MKTVTKMIDGKEFFPAFINGKDITTTDWLDVVTMDLDDNNGEHTFWLYGCLFLACDPERHGNTDNSGWFRLVYRQVHADLNAAHKAILEEMSMGGDMNDGFNEVKIVTEIVGNDIRYSFWYREIG